MRPVSVAAADFHGSAGFFVRVGIIGLATLGLFGVLALRLWSLQVVRGPHFAAAAQQQTFRLIDLPAPRGQIIDAKGRVLAGTRGGLGVSVDTAVLGRCCHHRHDASISSPPPDGLANEAVTSRSVAACNPAAIHETT